MKDRKLKLLSLAFLLSIACTPAQLMAGLPTDQVRQTADKVLLILQDPRLKSTDMREERRNQLRQVISRRFDFQAMAQSSLGPHLQHRGTEERRDFVELFTDLLEKTYADQIAAYNGEKIVYGRESQDKDYAEVDTKIVTTKGEEFSVNYKLRASSKEWKVYDVVIENISLVNNYRSQFHRVLANASFDDLLRKMREKQFAAPQTKGNK